MIVSEVSIVIATLLSYLLANDGVGAYLDANACYLCVLSLNNDVTLLICYIILCIIET